ncbi:hypothetical protein F5148DRAFT_1198957 [Russula earlei]|uniref:Uncharacterized protein n=1 Tax=Russula earlei TaxID=71964 RepID=A0ACC0UA63_9AGAM|nr:hypothetical protein F5148DRAFT_1198957 [Russula earlei]
MPSAHHCSTRIITLASLVALSLLSLTVIFGTSSGGNALDTQPRDSLFSFAQRRTSHLRRSLLHARLPEPAPQSGAPAPSNPAPNPPPPPNPTTPNPPNPPPPPPPPQPTPTHTPPPPPPPRNPASSSQAPPAPAPPPSPSPAPPPSPSPSAAPSPSPNPVPPPSSPLPSPQSVAPSLPGASSSVLPSASAPLTGTTNSSTGSLPGPTTKTQSNILNYSVTNFVYTPTTTTPEVIPTSSVTSSAVVSATPIVRGTTQGFFSHKGAVAAVFSIVGIIGGVFLLITGLNLRRRWRTARRRREEEEFFEKNPDARRYTVDLTSTFAGFRGSVRGSVLVPSTTELGMVPPSPNAYQGRDPHSYQPLPGTVSSPIQYGGMSYPPSGSSSSRPSLSGPSSPAPPMPGSPYVSYPRPIPGRGQEMVVTDSYYGPNSAGVGAGDVGHAQ